MRCYSIRGIFFWVIPRPPRAYLYIPWRPHSPNDPAPLPAPLFVPWKMIYASRKRTWVQVRWEASIMLQLIRTNCRTKCNVPGNNGFRALYANLECHKCNQLIKRTARWQRMSSFVSPTFSFSPLSCMPHLVPHRFAAVRRQVRTSGRQLISGACDSSNHWNCSETEIAINQAAIVT